MGCRHQGKVFAAVRNGYAYSQRLYNTKGVLIEHIPEYVREQVRQYQWFSKPEACRADDGILYVCSLNKGHTGWHVATYADGTILSWWL